MPITVRDRIFAGALVIALGIIFSMIGWWAVHVATRLEHVIQVQQSILLRLQRVENHRPKPEESRP